MKITVGEYNSKDLLKPLKEKVVGRRGHVRRLLENMNPSSGIWMVTLYRRGKLAEQFAVYNKRAAIEYVRNGQKTRTLKGV